MLNALPHYSREQSIGHRHRRHFAPLQGSRVAVDEEEEEMVVVMKLL